MKLINLPNSLTLVNLFAGCLAIVFIFSPGHLEYVGYCTLVSLVADYFDGFAARFTNTKTEIGKELDSLADMVSFGLVPGAILFSLLSFHFKSVSTNENEMQVIWSSAPAFLITLFSALRLAKFNLDTRQSDGFIGLATPANTIFVVGILEVFLHNQYGLSETILSPAFLFGITLAFSYLLIAEIPMFAFKFKSFGWAGNEIRYVFIIVSLLLLGVLKFAALSAIIVLYILTSVILFFYQKTKSISEK